MKKFALTATLLALFCSCQQQGNQQNRSDDQNFEQRRKEMNEQKKQYKNGCCQTEKDQMSVPVEKQAALKEEAKPAAPILSEKKQTVQAPKLEAKVETKEEEKQVQ